MAQIKEIKMANVPMIPEILPNFLPKIRLIKKPIIGDKMMIFASNIFTLIYL